MRALLLLGSRSSRGRLRLGGGGLRHLRFCRLLCAERPATAMTECSIRLNAWRAASEADECVERVAAAVAAGDEGRRLFE